jgi:protein TonB
VNLALGRVAEAVTVSAPGVPRANLAEITGRIRVGGNVQPASLVSRVNPAYPSTSQAAGIEGTVELLAIVGKDGAVHSLQVQSSNADHDLVEAAKSAVSQWRYSPAKLNGEPVEVITQIDVQFTLHP